MECPICLDAMSEPYSLKGCSHVICRSCSKQLKDQPESVHYAFKAIFVIESAPQIQLKCPLCRALEPVKSADELKRAYPAEYLEWMENELYRDKYDDSFSYTYTEEVRPKHRSVVKIQNRQKRVIARRWQGRKM